MSIKEKSLTHFLRQNVIDRNPDMRRANSDDPALFLDEELFLKKEVGLVQGQFIQFELEDRAMKSKKPLKNTYTFRVFYYDDVSIKLVLSDFKVEVV